MAENQNCTRMTRAAAKRKASSMAVDENNPVTKKRVVLGELPNMSNVVAVPVEPNLERDTLKAKASVNASKKQMKKKALMVPEPSVVIEPRSVDPQMCEPFANDIFAYLREMEGEPKYRPLPDYIEKVQNDITPHMRAVLVDWLVEVAEEYKLVSDTLYLTVSYIDRFLSVKPINRQKLQLVGVSAMLIASKYEEIGPPKVEDFCYITDNTFTKQEVVSMEADILLALQFELGCPTIKTFLRRFTRVGQEDFNDSQLEIEFLCCYLSELSMLDYTCVKYLPSLLAASAVFLARFIIRPKQHPWNQMLEEYTKYKAADLQLCVGIIHDLYLSRRGNTLEAVRNKYKQHKYKCVATMPVSPELPLAFFEDISIRGKA
ncbi:PREDICTED: cyclin-A3-4-like isoform X2 [Camelina sativa]|uniref:Cyclin-A3-4-like isoform X2 n=1 Tax=Camelina sativa TaxID=90675 RepID=A0ABM0VV38_CAMSA|nr:PREDICTED: cyclin-A3-4-like isoform X2 [Camelina sativa]